MVREGDWQVEVRVNGGELKQHTIEGHSCVQAVPDAPFEVVVEYQGFGGVFLVECLIDGKSVAGRYFLDPARVTSRGGRRSLTFKHWIKRQDGREVQHTIGFKGVRAAAKSEEEEEDDEGARPSVASWTQGKIEVRVITGVVRTLTQDTNSANHSADLSRDRPKVDEATLVKSGLSMAAGAGEVSFGQDHRGHHHE